MPIIILQPLSINRGKENIPYLQILKSPKLDT